MAAMRCTGSWWCITASIYKSCILQVGGYGIVLARSLEPPPNAVAAYGFALITLWPERQWPVQWGYKAHVCGQCKRSIRKTTKSRSESKKEYRHHLHTFTFRRRHVLQPVRVLWCTLRGLKAGGIGKMKKGSISRFSLLSVLDVSCDEEG